MAGMARLTDSICTIPTISVPEALKDKWKSNMLSTRSRTAKVVLYGRHHVYREDVVSAILKVVNKEVMESIYSTMTQKEYFITFRTIQSYNDFLTKTVQINTRNYQPAPFESNDIEIHLHWLNVEVPDDMIAYFPEEYCDEVKTIKHELDEYGIKTGIRTATIRLLDSQKPTFPHILKITPNIPMLITVPGRPPLCLRCHHLGHVRSACITPYFRHCQICGYTAESCKASYANATREKQPPPPPQSDQDKANSETDTDSDDTLFRTEGEAVAQDTQEWKTTRRKKKKKKNNPPTTLSVPPSTRPTRAATSAPPRPEPPTRSSTLSYLSTSDSEESMEEDASHPSTTTETYQPPTTATPETDTTSPEPTPSAPAEAENQTPTTPPVGLID